MKKYIVYYYINRQPHKFDFIFNSLFAATFKARAILEQHGYATDVMDCETGEILAIFEPTKTWYSEEITDSDVIYLINEPLE